MSGCGDRAAGAGAEERALGAMRRSRGDGVSGGVSAVGGEGVSGCDPTVPGSGIVYRKVLKIGIFGHCFISLAHAMSKKKGSRSPSLCQTLPPAALLGIPRTTSKQSSLSRGAISVDACWTGGEPSGQSIANWTGRNFRRGQLRLVDCCE